MNLVSNLLSRSLISDFNSVLTLSILLSSSLNLLSILLLRLFSTLSILLSSSLNLLSILLLSSTLTFSILVSSSVLRDLISACKRASTFSSLRLKVVSKYSISL
ncbi:hypothetical protein btBTE5EL_001363 (plasmid) [Borrelia turicatae]|nr:hypothetical protein btBTE5EL_001363 [Borrelia turicatae]